MVPEKPVFIRVGHTKTSLPASSFLYLGRQNNRPETIKRQALSEPAVLN